MPLQLSHDHRVIRGVLRIRAEGSVLDADAFRPETADPGPCPDCGVAGLEARDKDDVHGAIQECRACGLVAEHLMRALPCRRHRGRGDGEAELPDGSKYLMGAAPLNWPFVYQCGCGARNTMTAAQFNALPLLAYEDYKDDLPEPRASHPAPAVHERAIPISGSRHSKTGEIMGRFIAPAPPPAPPKIPVERVPLADVKRHIPRG